MAKASRTFQQSCFIIGLTSCFVLPACDSGSGGSGVTEMPPETDMQEDGQPPELLPDFNVIDVATAATTDGASLAFNATITNAGETSAGVPSGWVLISDDPDFTDNYHYLPVHIYPQGADEETMLSPGETRTFTAASRFGGSRVEFLLYQSQTYYTRLWLNPDLSARFLNPEATVIASYEFDEMDYTNNLSPLASFEFQGGPELTCPSDVYEDNDSIAQATPISLDTRYDFNGCDDLVEVLSVSMIAEQTYEIIILDRGDSEAWKFSLLTPDDQYLIRERDLDGALVTADTTGVHTLAITRRSPNLGGELSIEVRSR